MRLTKRKLAAGLLALLFAAFLALGFWQVERRAWKLQLIDRVESRVHAAPVDAPARLGDDEYRHVRASGRYLYDKQVFTQAVTERGAGFWVLTPLQRADGSVLLINRGFVLPEDRSHVASGPNGEVAVTGLLRLSEPKGGFLRSNDAVHSLWYSRDVAAIAQAASLQNVAPYFVDADRADAEASPVGGLTVITFHNSHLVYALTWFALALMSAFGAWRVLQDRQDAQAA